MPKLLRLLAVGPGFWTRVAEAEGKDPLEQSSWERGLAVVASQYESPRSPVWAVQAVLAGAAGVPLGNAVAVNSWGVQVLVGGTVLGSTCGARRHLGLQTRADQAAKRSAGLRGSVGGIRTRLRTLCEPPANCLRL